MARVGTERIGRRAGRDEGEQRTRGMQSRSEARAQEPIAQTPAHNLL
jgi:hypothetical protein